jgi:exonuclease SbcC
MIPLRVYVKNFLCYAEQEFRFEDHPVWLLHGPNGVGKSAVFDAMVYALYAESCRSDARKNAVVDVIRHGEASMRVEFDFEIGGQRYRVWRTRARSGQPKQGVNQWANGNWAPVRDVNGAAELKEWVRLTLGLTYETFVSAVLLRQGAAEKLIDAERDTRRELFRSFIDLDPFIDLHERVTTARTGLSAHIRQVRPRLNAMQIISDDQITAATIAAEGADQDLQHARVFEVSVRDLVGHARAWEQLEKTKGRIRGELDAASGRAARGAVLEKQVRRLQHLRVLVPSLIRVSDLQRALAVADETLNLRISDQAKAIVLNEGLNTRLAETRAHIVQHHNHVTDLDRHIVACETEQKRLLVEISRADQATDLHNKLGVLKGKEFDQDLDERTTAAENSLLEAQSLKEALPHLDAVARNRNEYRLASAEEVTATGNEAAASAEAERLRQAEAIALAECTNATTAKSNAEQAAAVAKDQCEKAIERRDRFAAATTNPVCSECGQPIDATHAAVELANLERAVQSAEENSRRCCEEVRARSTDTSAALSRHRQIALDYRDAEQRLNAAIRGREAAQTRGTNAKAAFDRAADSLTEPFAKRVGEIASESFPTTQDLVDIRAIAKDVKARIKHRDDLLAQQRGREQTKHDIQVLEQSLSAVGAPADVTDARTEVARVENSLIGQRAERTRTESRHSAAEKSEQEFLAQQQQLALQISQLTGDVGSARTEVASAQRGVNAAIAMVPDSHRATALTTPTDELTQLSDELSELAEGHVEEEFAALAEDRALQADRERQLEQVEQQITLVPVDARRAVVDIEQQVSKAETGTRKADERHDQARTQLRSLTEQRDQRRETERQLGEAERDHSLYDRLAGLLGPDGIQLDLVRGAERRIIVRANDILVRLSTGELRFEPPDAESSRAFDLSIRRSGCPDPIAVTNLSGGQRFRVAVSLALAVCQGAGDASRPLEAVIIDEGFGALDRDGRMAMITELRDGQTLAHMFKRVIVVSHQDDFAAAFPVGYRLRSDGGTTAVEAFGIAGHDG